MRGRSCWGCPQLHGLVFGDEDNGEFSEHYFSMHCAELCTKWVFATARRVRVGACTHAPRRVGIGCAPAPFMRAPVAAFGTLSTLPDAAGRAGRGEGKVASRGEGKEAGRGEGKEASEHGTRGRGAPSRAAQDAGVLLRTASTEAVCGLLQLLQHDTAGLRKVLPLVIEGPRASDAARDLALCRMLLAVGAAGRNLELAFTDEEETTHEDAHARSARRMRDGLAEVVERAFGGGGGGGGGGWVDAAKRVRACARAGVARRVPAAGAR